MAYKHINPRYTEMTPEEKIAYLQECRRRGGKARAAQESMALARSKAFQTTMERHPLSWSWLQKKIKAHNLQKSLEQNLSLTEYQYQRVRLLHLTYIRLEEKQSPRKGAHTNG